MDSKEELKPTLKSRLEDIWDTYKLLVIFGALGLIVLIIVVSQMLTAVEHDIHILYTGSGVVDQYSLRDLQTNATTLDPSLSSSEEPIDLLEFTVQPTLTDNGEFIYNQSILTRFNAEVRTCESLIYIVEHSYYEKLLEGGFLAPLETVLTDYPEGAAVDEYGLDYSMLAISSLDGFDVFQGECVLCFRRPINENEIKYIDDEMYNKNLAFFVKMVGYEKSEDAAD